MIALLYLAPFYILILLQWSTIVYAFQPTHIATFNSTLDTLISKRGLNDYKLLSFDDHTHFLLGNLHDHNGKVEMNHKVTIADYSSRYSYYTTKRDKNNATVPGPYNIQMDVPSWGLSRISQRRLPLMNVFGYPNNAGKGVDIYILDSGVDVNHTDFEGRAIWGGNFVPGSPDVDENGHGTILAGIAAGTKYGVAKKANIISVKCLAANGTGDVGIILEGLHYILNRIQSRPQTKAIVNLSLVAQESLALNQATDALTRAGAIVVAAAGNNHEGDDPSKRNACNYSPASASTVITVGSTDDKDQFASFSKDGKCVDILAPGTAILSDTLANVKTWYSGTSYSAPHVAGVLALLDQGVEQLYNLATPGIIANVTNGTANLLVFNGVETSQMSSITESTHHRGSSDGQKILVGSSLVVWLFFVFWIPFYL